MFLASEVDGVLTLSVWSELFIVGSKKKEIKIIPLISDRFVIIADRK